MKEKLVPRALVYALVCVEEDDRVVKGSVLADGGGRRSERSATQRSGLQRTPRSMRVVGRGVWKKSSVTRSERTRSSNVGTKAIVDKQRESNGGGSKNGGVTEGKETVGATAPRRDSRGAPEGICVISRLSGKRRERTAESLNVGAEMEAREGDKSYLPWMVIVEKVNLVKVELEKTKKDRYSLMTNSQLTQKKLQQVRGKLKEKDISVESLRKAVKTRKSSGVGQGRREKVKKL